MSITVTQLAYGHRQVVVRSPQRDISILAFDHETPLQAIERHAEELQCDIDTRQRRVNSLRAAATQIQGERNAPRPQ